MKSGLQRRAFAALSLGLLGALPLAVALYVHLNSAFVPLPLGHKVPGLVALSTDGQVFIQDTMGSKKSLLVFFAPACSHCRRELSNLNDLLPRYKDKLNILGVSLDDLQSTRTTAAELKLKFPVVVAGNEQPQRAFKVNILPAFFCIDEKQILRNYFTGEHSVEVDEHLLEDFIFSSSAL